MKSPFVKIDKNVILLMNINGTTNPTNIGIPKNINSWKNKTSIFSGQFLTKIIKKVKNPKKRKDINHGFEFCVLKVNN